jgi:phosphoribosyl 1,2-cyclic phosphate phosphodiesterase
VKLRFLGTGTSFGVPVVGCRCEVCTSEDPRDRRTRHGLLVEEDGRRLLVDTPPELRLQLLEAGTRHLDGVFLTHPHADHCHGIDDLRIFTLRSERALRVHVAREYEEELRARFGYIWGNAPEASPGTTVPDLEMVTFGDRDRIRVAGFRLVPVGLPHGNFTSYGFRLGDLAVVVDAKRIPEDAVELLQGVDVLVVNALWHGNPHPTHFNVEEAVETARLLDARRTYLTHMTHRLRHAELDERLPDAVRPAYDGLEVEL